MTPNSAPLDPEFTRPSDAIVVARVAIARLQMHFEDAVDSFDESADVTSLLLAWLSLETIDPPYPPLPLDLTPSVDPRADLEAAITALLQLSAEATTARETLRFAYVVRDLREVENSPYLATGSARP
jgi:hypothetical protein